MRMEPTPSRAIKFLFHPVSMTWPKISFIRFWPASKVLRRVPQGISLFIVPKIWVNDDGSLGEPNDVVCTGVEEKMGIHGNATCSMSLGSKGNCRGMLLGEENKGHAFHVFDDE